MFGLYQRYSAFFKYDLFRITTAITTYSYMTRGIYIIRLSISKCSVCKNVGQILITTVSQEFVTFRRPDMVGLSKYESVV